MTGKRPKPRRRTGGATVTTRRRTGRRDSMRRRLAAQIRPHQLIAATAATGWIGAAGGAAAGAPGTAGLVLAATGAATTGIVAAARRRRRRALTGRQVAGSLAAAGWVGAVTAAGVSPPTLAALAVGGVGLSLRHWRRHRLPDPPAATRPPDVDELDPVRLWARHVASDGGPLVGTSLSGRVDMATGPRFDLHLVPGRQALTDARAALPKLRTGLLLLPGQDLVVEQHPVAHEAVLQLTFVRQSTVLTTAQPWPGGTYDPDRGTIALGPYVDADGVAEWILAADQGLYGGFMTGATRSGKSRMMESVALGAAAAGCAVWFADPQGGASSPWLADHADWTARSVDAARGMLRAALAVKNLRQAENAYHGWDGWTPDQGRPGLLLFIDECHRVFADPICHELAVELAREGGKCGVAIVAASQVATLDVWGTAGTADALRSSVTAGNVVLLRTKSTNTKGVLATGGVDPTQFPRIAGYAYLLDDTGTRRSAPLRGYYLDDASRDRAAVEVTWSTLGQGAGAAAGAAYLDRREQAEIDRQQLAARIEALTSGQAAAELPAAPPATEPAAAPARPAAGVGSLIPTFPLPPTATPPAAVPEPAAVAGGAEQGSATAVDAVAAALAAGADTPAALRAATGYGETSVREALKALIADGRAHQPRYGRYALTTTTTTTAAPVAAGR